MAGSAGPVALILVALIALWYLAAVWMNAPFVRQVAPDPAALSATDLVLATWSQERPVLPAPHQVAAELWRSVAAVPVTSRRVSALPKAQSGWLRVMPVRAKNSTASRLIMLV